MYVVTSFKKVACPTVFDLLSTSLHEFGIKLRKNESLLQKFVAIIKSGHIKLKKCTFRLFLTNFGSKSGK